MDDNTYYEIDIPNENMTDICAVIVETEYSMKKSLDGLKAIVRLHDGDNTNHPCLSSSLKLTHREAYDLAHSLAYQLPIE